MQRADARRFPIRTVLGLLFWLTLVRGFAQATNDASVFYTAFRFVAAEGWSATSPTPGATLRAGHQWQYDFTEGAPWVALAPDDRALPTRPERFRLRVHGTAKGHPVHVYLRSHFMTFHRRVGEIGQVGEQELVFDAPPGPGWEWFGGENDGKLHGPLRLGEIRLEANGVKDRGSLQMISLAVEGRCPTNRFCTLTAEPCPQHKKACFWVHIQSVAGNPLYGNLRWTLRDWERNILGRGGKAIILPVLGEQLDLEIAAAKLPGKLQFAEAEFELEVEGQAHPPVQAYWLKAPKPTAKAELRPESPFGMGVYLCRYDTNEMERVAQLAQEAGVKWSREDLSWSALEPQPGQYRWEWADHLLACARRHGITVYPIVAFWPSWAKAYTTEGIDQYVAFLRAMVQRYRTQVKHWEIWNEPNIFFWQGTREQYAELLTKSYRAIKELDPQAEVLGLSTAGIDFKYIEWMLERQVPFDILTIHPYRKTFDDPAFVDDLKRVSDLVRLPDGRRRPVWLTELGWATHVPHQVLRQDLEPNTQRTQAELLARVYLCSIVSGVEPRTFWYNFRNDGEDPVYFEHNLGILRQDNSPKPAYLAFQTLTRTLEGLRYQGPVSVTAGSYAYRFARADRPNYPTFVLWNPKQDAAVELDVPAARVKLINTIGETEQVKTLPLPGQKTIRRFGVNLRAGAVVYVETQP